jgi:uncharacterized cupin superfamily protein
MSEPEVSFATLNPDTDERFQRVRQELGVTSFGLNLMVLQPGQRSRVHMHERQEEVYIVQEGELTLVLEGEEHVLGPGRLARVGHAVRRQLVNRGSGRLVMVAIGGHGEHQGRDGRAWESWDEGGEGRPPQEVPLPEDLPAG